MPNAGSTAPIKVALVAVHRFQGADLAKIHPGVFWLGHEQPNQPRQTAT